MIFTIGAFCLNQGRANPEKICLLKVLRRLIFVYLYLILWRAIKSFVWTCKEDPRSFLPSCHHSDFGRIQSTQPRYCLTVLLCAPFFWGSENHGRVHTRTWKGDHCVETGSQRKRINCFWLRTFHEIRDPCRFRFCRGTPSVCVAFAPIYNL